MLQLEAQLAETQGGASTLTPEARAWLAEKGYDPLFGARPLARVIQTEVEDRLADELLFGRLAKGGRVRVGVEDVPPVPGSEGLPPAGRSASLSRWRAAS
ncbi:MAG: hypothetical protein MZV70_45300 [Desulfobacterales bacterium]|nr:hypothetical protein [Desulfobacterales bacterium]